MIRILATGLAACSLAACVSVLPEPKVPEGLYRFAPMETVYDLEDSVIVREPDASRLVAGRAIASEDSSGALRLVPNVEWTDSSTRLMQMAMLDALQGQGAGKAIAPETGAAQHVVQMRGVRTGQFGHGLTFRPAVDIGARLFRRTVEKLKLTRIGVEH